MRSMSEGLPQKLVGRMILHFESSRTQLNLHLYLPGVGRAL